MSNKQEWKEGIDLPPIGETVVVYDNLPHSSYKHVVGNQVVILFHDTCDQDAVAVFKTLSEDERGYVYHGLIARCFKKVKTKEQLEAEEREKTIQEMEKIVRKYDIRSISKYLYDAGFRKLDVQSPS